MNRNITEHRVRYSDTDHFGVVYYARYLDWFEAGRTEILRAKGVTYADLEKKGFFAPVVEIKVNYNKPAKYDDIIILKISPSLITIFLPALSLNTRKPSLSISKATPQ